MKEMAGDRPENLPPTPYHTTFMKPPACPRVDRSVIVCVFSCFLAACTTGTNISRSDAARPITDETSPGSHWVQIRENPPTWYPRGTPWDCATDHHAGEWVETGDHKGTRYFIPLHDIGVIQRQSLVNEALAARSASKQARIAGEECEIFLGSLSDIIVGVPLTAMALCGTVGTSKHYGPEEIELINPLNP